MASDSNSKGKYAALEMTNRPSKVEEQDENENEISQDTFPLHYAARLGKVDKLRELLKAGNHKISDKDSNERTPLHWAALGRNHRQAFKCVKALLTSQQIGEDTEKKINYINTPDKNGETAVHLAAKKESKKITEYLFVAGGSVTIRSNEGREPKHFIIEKIPEAMVRLCDTSIKYLSGETTDSDLKVDLAFGSIAGTMWKQSESEIRGGTKRYVKNLPVESDFLKNALDASHKHCKDILSHPQYTVWVGVLEP